MLDIPSVATLRRTAPTSARFTAGGVTLQPEPFLGVGKVQLAGHAAAAMFRTIFGEQPPAAGASMSAHELTVSWLAPGEWLLTGDEEDVRAMLERVDAATGDLGLATDLTHARAALMLSGSGARDRLASLTPIDLSDAALPIDAVARAPLGDTGMFLARLSDVGGEPRFRILVDQTMAAYAVRMLAGPASATEARP